MSTGEPIITHEDIERIAYYLVGMLHNDVDKEEYFQIAYLEGLEALERNANVFGSMKAKLSHEVAFAGSPVEVPPSGANHSALAKMKRGQPLETPAEKRVASVLKKREEVLPITVVTYDTPESLLVEKQLKEKLETLMAYDKLYLTPKQRDAIGVLYFGEPLPENFMLEYGVGYEGIRWHSKVALEKLKTAITC